MTRKAPFLLILLLLGASLQASHDESLGARFVDPEGVDASSCLDHHAPCRSLAYALQQAEPGNTVRVGAGEYDLRNVDPETFLWGPVKARGGYGEATEWEVPDPAANPTIVTGLAERYRAVLAARGFTLVHKSGAGPGSTEPLQAAQLAVQVCTSGFAGQFPCANVDFLAQIGLTQFSSRPASAANVWGLVDRNDNREYAVIGLANATAVIDVTDPVNPREVGSVAGNPSIWREVKIFQHFDVQQNRFRAYAYISTEAPGSGLQVIDLSGLPNSIALAGTLADTATQHTVYVSNIDYTYNTALPGAEPFLYVAGSNLGNGRWRAYSLANPAVPALAGTAPAGTGYMHDSTGMRITDSRVAQCGSGHDPCDVLIDFNENAVEIWDVTTKSAPLRLSSTSFASFRYVHSGWPSSDQRFVVVHDELDEIRGSVAQTNIYTLDLADLRAPVLNVSWVGPNSTTDHNGYAKGSRYYVSHYRRGLVVFDATDPRRLREIGSFDTFLMSQSNTAGTDGAWGVYPFLPSGTVLVSDIDNGLFLLRDNTSLLAGVIGALGVATTTAQFAENAGTAAVRVQRLGGSTGAVSVQYATRDGTAVAGADYTATSGTLAWADGDLADKTISIALLDDGATEPNESFDLVLSAATGGATLGAATTAVTIANDDATAPPRSSGGGGGAIDPLFLVLLAFALGSASRARARALLQAGLRRQQPMSLVREERAVTTTSAGAAAPAAWSLGALLPRWMRSSGSGVDSGSRATAGFWARAALGVFVLAAASAHAQELEPRTYSNTPVGLNFLIVGYAYSEGGLSLDPALPIEDAELQIDTGVLGYAHSLDWWGKAGKFDVVAAYSDLSGSALVAGEPVTRAVDGFGDPRFRLSVILYGAPALSLREFASYKQDTVIGASVQVSVPVGQYDPSRAVNLGTNRWSVKPEVGLSKALGALTLELTGSVTFYSTNDDYFGGKTRQQDPVYSTQAHVIYGFGRGIWGALNATYYWGGRTTIDGVTGDTRLGNSRVGATLALPVNRLNSIKLYASTGVSTRTGTDFDTAGLAWQYRWGAGL